jgi:hypothetical protein
MTPNLYLNAFGISPPFSNPPEIFWKLIIETIEAFNRRNKLTHHRVPDEPFDIIWISYFHTELNEWIAKFTHIRTEALRSYQTPPIFWLMISVAISSHEVRELHQKLHPIPTIENHRRDTRPIPAPQKIGPEPTTKPKRKKPYQKRLPLKPVFRWSSVSEFILRQSPSPAYELVYSTTLRFHNRALSERGKKVYSKGQAYIKKATGLNRSTVDRAWSWLKRRGIFNKARNENPREHRCSLWYVCTSMKQVAYFRDPENRHRKTKPQD